MQAGNCRLNSTRLSFLLVNLSLLLIDKKRLQACTVWFCPPVTCDFQTYALMQTNDLKAGIHHLHRDLFRLSWNYLETGLYRMQLLCFRQVLHSVIQSSGCTYTYSQVPDCPLCFHLSHARWLGLALQLLIPLFFFSQFLTKCHVNLT